jgi:hypothetical protein
MPCDFRQSGSLRPLDAGDSAEQRAAIFVDNYNAILSGDEQTVIHWIGHDIVPPTVPQSCRCAWRGYDEDDCATSDVAATSVKTARCRAYSVTPLRPSTMRIAFVRALAP